MQQNRADIADLLTNESFINYCKRSSQENVAYWENYVKQNPGQKEFIDLARERFLLLFNALATEDLVEQTERLRNRLGQKAAVPVIRMEDRKEAGKVRKFSFLKISGVAAALLIAGLLAIWHFTGQKLNSSRHYMAAYGERKNIQLPDGSVVNLNAGSKIEIDGSFGVTNRNVKLEGEAFFDVRHNKSLPFVVLTRAMNVKALGTAFDVKAYHDESTTEASLIRGLVEVTLKENSNRTLLLHPNQKITWKEPEIGTANAKNNNLSIKNGSGEGDQMPVTVTVHGDIKEIAWKENKLVFEDDSFSDIAVLLERWYGITIKFTNDAIRNYHFTAVFEKEDLQTVLGFLKESRDFNFNIETGENTTVYLSK